MGSPLSVSAYLLAENGFEPWSPLLAGSAVTHATREKPLFPWPFDKYTLEPSFEIEAAPSRSAKVSQFASQSLHYIDLND